MTFKWLKRHFALAIGASLTEVAISACGQYEHDVLWCYTAAKPTDACDPPSGALAHARSGSPSLSDLAGGSCGPNSYSVDDGPVRETSSADRLETDGGVVADPVTQCCYLVKVAESWSPMNCSGRPFVVGGEARVAELRRGVRSSWCADVEVC